MTANDIWKGLNKAILSNKKLLGLHFPIQFSRKTKLRICKFRGCGKFASGADPPEKIDV